MEAIRIWLNGKRDYATGVQLYRQFGGNESLKRMFREEYSDFKARKLAAALQELVEGRGAAVVEQKAAEQAVVQVTQKQGRKEYGYRAGMDEVETALYTEARAKLKELDYLCAIQYDLSKAAATNPDKLGESSRVAFRSLELDEEIGRIYQKLDYYREHKRLPEEPKPMQLAQDPVRMATELKNAERYVRDYRAKLEKDPGNARAAHHLKKWQWAVQEYKKALKLD